MHRILTEGCKESYEKEKEMGYKCENEWCGKVFKNTACLLSHKRHCRIEGKKTNSKRPRVDRSPATQNKKHKVNTDAFSERLITSREEEAVLRGERPGSSTDFSTERQKVGASRDDASPVGKRVRPDVLTDEQLENLKKKIKKDYQRCDKCRGVFINKEKLDEHKKTCT